MYSKPDYCSPTGKIFATHPSWPKSEICAFNLLPVITMKKLFPIRSYFVRAKVFGFIVIFIALVYLVYFILDLLEV